MTTQFVALLLFSFFLGFAYTLDKPSQHKWAVKINGNAEQVAEESGFENLGPVGKLKDVYLFQMKEDLRNSRDVAVVEKHENLLKDHSSIVWAEEQIPRRMVPK